MMTIFSFPDFCILKTKHLIFCDHLKIHFLIISQYCKLFPKPDINNTNNNTYTCANCMKQRVNLELLVADYDRIGSSDPIGKVLLGYNRKGLELKHWKEMIENPRRPIVHWHVLKVKHQF